MDERQNIFDANSSGAVTAAVLLGTVGVLSFIVQPGLAFGFVDAFGVSEDAANSLLAMEGFGIASGAVIAAILSRFANWRVLIAIALALAAIGNVFSGFASSPDLTFSTARFATGLGEGGIIVLSFAMISLTDRIERNLAIYLTVLLTYGAIGLWFAPQALDLIGLNGVFWVWAGITTVSLAIVPLASPRASVRQEPRPTAANIGLVMLIVAVISVLLYNTAIGLAWANLFFVGLSIEPNENAVAQALLVSQFAAIVGALVAILLEKKIGQWLPIISGLLAGAASLAFLLGKPNYAIFFASVCVFNFAWNFFLPFMLSAVEDMRKGEMMTVTVATQMLGLTVGGPLIAAEILKLGGSLQLAIQTALVLILVSLALLIPAKIKHSRILTLEQSSRFEEL